MKKIQFNLIPEKKGDIRFSLNYFVCLTLISGHIAVFTLFCILKIPFLAILSLIGIAIYILIYRLLKYECINLGMFLCATEIVTLIWFQLRYLGWDSGFHYYFLCIAPVIFLAEVISLKLKVLATTLFMIIYIAFHQYFFNAIPLVSLSDNVLIMIWNFNLIVLFVALTAIARYYSVVVLKSEDKLKDINKNLLVISQTDQLTGLFNRRHILYAIEKEILLFETQKEPFVLAIADIDNFKQINDTYGHDYGDQILIKIADCIKQGIRRKDTAARWGGEEFLFLLPKTDINGGTIALNKIRESIAKIPLEKSENISKVTVTIGAVVFNGNRSIDELIKIADENLYAGKHSDKNCVVS